MTEKLNPDAIADDGSGEFPSAQEVTCDMILDYVIDTEQLPKESAEPFAEYADRNWYEYNDGDGTITNGQIIEGMLAYWRGQ